MKTKAELFACFGECLAASSLIWLAGISFIMIDAEVPLPGVWWSLLMTIAAASVYILILRRGTTVRVLAAVSVILLAGEITALLFLYKDNISFGYVITSILMACVSVYVSMYLCIKKQILSRHMSFIDIMIGVLVWLTVFYTARGGNTYSTLCIIAVTVMNVAAAIGLRMSEGGTDEGVGKAFALAAVSSAAAAAVIYFLVRLFSRSGAVTGAVLNGIRDFFIGIGKLIGRFIDWLASFISEPDMEAVPDAMPQTGMESGDISFEEVSVNPVIPAVIIGAVIVLIAVWIVRKTAREKVSLSLKISGEGTAVRSRKKKGLFAKKWRKFIENMRFRWRAFVERDTSPGLLVWLERKALKKKMPRSDGESIREFTLRLAPDGTLEALTSDLEKKLYGASEYDLSAKECRSIRKDMKKRFRERA